MNQLGKLKKVLEFYQQQLEIIKIKFKEQRAVVNTIQTLADELSAELVTAQQQFSNHELTPSNLQMAHHVMDLIETRIGTNRKELLAAEQLLDVRRAELRVQMTKLEALENLVSRKSKLIEHQQRQRGQHLADERYLNTKFNGLMK